MTSNTPDPVPSGEPAALSYATPASRAGSPTAAAALVAVFGVALVLLGGCFLVGVLICGASPNAGSFELSLLSVVLYVVAFACFGGAAWLLLIGVGRLVGIMRG